MGQRSVRFPDGLEARAVALAESQDRSFSYVVVKATEAWLDRLERLNGTTPIGQGEGPVSSRAPVEKEPLSDRELQGLRNIAESSVGAEVERHQARPSKPSLRDTWGR